MRYKAISDEYGKSAKLGLIISLLLYFGLVGLLFIPAPTTLIAISYSLLSLTIIILFSIMSLQRNTIKSIGCNRYITMYKAELFLEDKINGRNFSRSYAWDSIESIIIKNVTPYDKFNKNKTLTITFVINQADYNYFITRSKLKASKKAEYINSFFTVMYSKEVLDEIRKNRVGAIEDLSGQSILMS